MNCKICQYLMITFLTIIGLSHTIIAQQTESTISINMQLENVLDFALSQDESRLLVAETDGDLYIWDINLGEITLTIHTNTSNTTLNSISWSSDDSLIAGAFSDKGRIWDSQTGELMYELDEYPRQPIFEGVNSGIDGIIFSSNGSSFATYHMLDTTILLYNQQTHAIKYELQANDLESYVLEMIFSPDSSKLAVRQLSGHITVWSTYTGEKLYQFLGEAMAFSPDSTMLVTGIGRLTSHVWIWDLSSGNQLYEIVAPLQVNQLHWGDNNQTIYGRFGAPPLSDGWIYNGEAIRSWNISELTNDQIFSLSENIRLPFVGNEQMTIIGLGSYQLADEILIWDRSNDNIFRHAMSTGMPEHNYTVFVKPIYIFDIHHNLLVTGYDDKIVFWDIATGVFQAISSDRIVKLDFISLNDMVISLTNNNLLIVYSINILL